MSIQHEVSLIIFREKPQDAEWLDLRSRKVPLLLNFAQCKLSKKEYYPVIEHTTEVLESDPGEPMIDPALQYG